MPGVRTVLTERLDLRPADPDAELRWAAIAAATSVDPDAPVIAWVAEHNLPSRRVAERLGLRDRGLPAGPERPVAPARLRRPQLDDALLPPV